MKGFASFGKMTLTIGGLCVLFSLAIASGKKSETPTGPVGSPDQVAFHQRLADFAAQYRKASGDLQKSAVFRDMAGTMTRQGYLFQNWEGTLRRVTTNEGGQKASIEIENAFAGMEVEYKTWNNDLSDMFDNTMIPLGSPVYQQLEKIPEGSTVVFSGAFLTDDGGGYKQSNLTEMSKVTDPEILIRITAIKLKQ